MSKVVIIGAGGVGNVVAHNVRSCRKFLATFYWRPVRKPNVAIAESVAEKQGRQIRIICALDADDVAATTQLLQAEQPPCSSMWPCRIKICI